MRSAISRMRARVQTTEHIGEQPVDGLAFPASAAVPDAGGFAEAGEAGVGVDQDDGVFRGLVRAEAALERLRPWHAARVWLRRE